MGGNLSQNGGLLVVEKGGDSVIYEFSPDNAMERMDAGLLLQILDESSENVAPN